MAKILKTDSFITERVKLKPITNAEWERTKNEIKKLKEESIVTVSSEDDLYWVLYNLEMSLKYEYKSCDWYMLQNHEIMLFWNKDSKYYPFFFKKDINAIISHVVGAGSKEWCVMKPYMLRETIPTNKDQAYDLFVKEFSLSKMTELGGFQTIYNNFDGVIGHTRVNYNIIQGLDYIYVPNKVVELIKNMLK